jgi:hypothetical protein
MFPDKRRGYELPNSLPFLTILHLGLSKLPINIKEVSFPKLQKLSLGFDFRKAHLILTLLECKGIPFNQIEVLSANIPERFFLLLDNFQFRDAYYGVLQARESIKEIHRDEFSAPLILKLLRDGIGNQVAYEAGGICEHPIYFSDGIHRRELRAGREDRMLDIDTISREIGWMHIEVPWEKMKGRYYGYAQGEQI